jgi:hypothetical protein
VESFIYEDANVMKPKKSEADAKATLEAEIIKSRDLCKNERWQEAIDHMRSIGMTFRTEGFSNYRIFALREVDKIYEEWRSKIARQLSELKLAGPIADMDKIIETLNKIREEARNAKFDLIIKDINTKIETIAAKSKQADLHASLDKIPQPWKAPDPGAALHELEDLEREVRKFLGEIALRIASMRAYGQLTTLFKASRRISIEDFCKAINMSLDQALPLIYDMTMKLNFIIDGRFLELKSENIEMAIAQIDKYFSEWRSREKVIAEKI